MYFLLLGDTLPVNTMIALVVFAIFVLFLIKTSFAISRFIETQNQLSTVPGPQCELVNGNLNLFSRQTQKLSSEGKEKNRVLGVYLRKCPFSILVFYNTLKAIARLYQNEGIFKLRFGNKFIVCVSQKKHLKVGWDTFCFNLWNATSSFYPGDYFFDFKYWQIRGIQLSRWMAWRWITFGIKQELVP